MSVTTVDVDSVWNELHESRHLDSESVEDASLPPTRDASGVAAPKRARTANYRKLNNCVDQLMLEHAVIEQLHHARVEAYAKLDEIRSPHDVIADMRVGAYRPHEMCGASCQTEQLRIPLYLCEIEDNSEAAARMRAATHMFLSPAGIAVAGRLGLLTTTECARGTIHVCSPYCPGALADTYPEIAAAMEADDDEDRVWTDNWWHRTKLAAKQLPETIYRCVTHNRFHVCGSTCEHMLDGDAGNRMCPISQRVVSDVMQHSFGDGVGTAEQQSKTAEAKGGGGGDGEGENDRKRRSIYSARARLFEAATVIVDGKRVRRTAGVRSTTSALKRKAGKAKKVTPEDQQARIVETLTAAEVAECAPYDAPYPLVASPQATKIEAIAQVPFSERVAGKHDHQFAFDRFYDMEHRTTRRSWFALGEAVNRQALFASPHLFAQCAERAASVFYQLHMGRQRQAIEAARLDKAKPKAQKAVDAYLAECAKSGATVHVARCVAIYESTLSMQTRRYPQIELSAEMYASAEAYYAARAVMFYFGLMALPVRRVGRMRADEIETIRTAFGFEAFCVVIYDLMRTGYTVRNVTLLARDTFLLERLYPSSSVLKTLGMPEKPCTNIKGLITTILKVANRYGVSLAYCMDTTLPWPEIGLLSIDGGPRAVVRALVQRRVDQLHALRCVRPPSPPLPLPSE
jgi:hypothetical protein